MLSFLAFLASLGLADNPANNLNNKHNHQQSHKHQHEDRHLPGEQTGPFKTVYSWKQLDYAFPSEYDRRRAIESKEFIQENNLPLGLEIYKNKLFITMPKWKEGIPVTLAVLPKVPKEKSPKLVPYPNWEYHTTGK